MYLLLKLQSLIGKKERGRACCSELKLRPVYSESCVFLVRCLLLIPPIRLGLMDYLMQPRSTAKSPVKTQINTHPQYNGPITRSRTASSLADAPIEQHGIDDLPFEVLSTIFVLSLASEEEIIKRSSEFGTNPLPNPLPLCAVSSLWRTLALATPKLWSRVFVSVTWDRSNGTIKSKVRLVPWIKHSGSLPLTLFIWYPDMPYPDGSALDNSVEKVINRYAFRWETLYVLYTDELYEARGRNLLRVDKWNSLQRMYGVRPHDNISTCAQLTHLQFCRRTTVSYAQVVEIFKGCPRLVSLSLSIKVAPEFINVHTSPIILRDLSFFSFLANHLSTIFQLVSLPSLRELVYWQTFPFTEAGLFRSLQSFLTRSACTLDKMKMHGIYSLGSDLVQLLTHRSCNSLTSLGIYYNAPVDDEVLRTLTLHHDNSACTHLKFLSLNLRATQSYYSQSVLRTMIESRIGSCTTSQPQDGLLLHLQIDNYCKPRDSQQWLDEVIKANEMEYESQEYETRDRHRSLCIWRRGFSGNIPALHDFFGT
jgi:hypothetical protein